MDPNWSKNRIKFLEVQICGGEASYPVRRSPRIQLPIPFDTLPRVQLRDVTPLPPPQVEQCGELLGLVVDREGERADVHAEMAVVALLLGLVRLLQSLRTPGVWVYDCAGR